MALTCIDMLCFLCSPLSLTLICIYIHSNILPIIEKTESQTQVVVSYRSTFLVVPTYNIQGGAPPVIGYNPH